MKGTERICWYCHQPFHLSLGEQQFFLSRGLKTPRRCPACRQRRKADPYDGWEETMRTGYKKPTHHTRVHYAPYVVGGMRG